MFSRAIFPAEVSGESVTDRSFGLTGDFARVYICVVPDTTCVCVFMYSYLEKTSHRAHSYLSKYLGIFINAAAGKARARGEGGGNEVLHERHIVFLREKGNAYARRERPHNSPIMRAGCVMHVDNRRLRGIYVTCVR